MGAAWPPPSNPPPKSDAWLVLAVIMVALMVIIAAAILTVLPRPPEDRLPPLVEWPKDRDGDLYPDDEDAFPDDPDEWADTNLNGMGDNSETYPNDNDSDGYNDLVDVRDGYDAGVLIRLQTIRVVDEVDLLTGLAEVYFVIEINDREEARIDDMGYPYILDVGSTYQIDKSFRFNVDDNRRYTKFSISMFDEDFMSEDDQIDIDAVNRGDKILDVKFDLIDGTWYGDDVDGSADGSMDGTQEVDDEDAILGYSLEIVPISGLKTYAWTFAEQEYELQLDLSAKQYYQLKYSEVERWPATYDEARIYVTVDDGAVVQIAEELSNMSQHEGFSELETANFVLSFVQSIDYSFDNASAGANEYWRFPLETLYDETGDCEDTSILYASIIEVMGYDAVLLLLPGHMAVGLECPGASGGHYAYVSVEYYYCETTGPGWEVGEVPPEMRNAIAEVFQVP